MADRALKRGELYRVRHPSGDAKRARVFVVVSRPAFLRARHSTAVCAPMYSNQLGLSTEVSVGPAEGLKHASSIQCDLLVSVDRSRLTDYVGSLDAIRIRELDEALQVALALEGA